MTKEIALEIIRNMKVIGNANEVQEYLDAVDYLKDELRSDDRNIAKVPTWGNGRNAFEVTEVCPNCGSLNYDNYCSNCGQKIVKITPV